MSEKPTIDDLSRLVDQFKTEIGYTRNLPIKGPHHRYDFVDDPAKEPRYPHAGEPGCYVFFNSEGAVLYVGRSARDEGMGDRIWDPFGRRRKDGENDPFPVAKPWVKLHKPGVWAVAVPKEHWWLAMALEGFLIEEFDPPENKGRH
jgi:hypothetical protein